MLKRHVVFVALTTPDDPTLVEHRLEITPGDQFRAELEAAKHGLEVKRSPIQVTAGVWSWCALVRLGLYSEGYQKYVNRDLYAFELEREAIDVPPTQEPSGSASPSPTSSPE